MKILQVVLSGNPSPAIFGGAVQQTVDELSKKHKNLGNQVVITSISRNVDLPLLTQHQEDGVKYKYVTTKRDNLRKINLRLLFRHLKNAQTEGKFDVVHTHSPLAAYWFYLFKGLIGNPKIVCHIHNRSRFMFLLRRTPIEQVGVSESVLQINKYHQKTYRVIHNICRTENFPIANKEDKDKARIEFNIHRNAYVILFVGRISKEKGLDILLESVRNIESKDKDIVILVAGGGWFKNSKKTKYQHSIEHLSTGLNVRWLGYIDNWKLKDLYAISDILVFPSVWEEPAGQVLLEAQSCGTKVLASNIGGIPEYLSPFEETFSAGNSEELKSLIIYNIMRPDTYMLDRSKWVRSNFDSDKISREWLDCYSKKETVY